MGRGGRNWWVTALIGFVVLMLVWMLYGFFYSGPSAEESRVRVEQLLAMDVADELPPLLHEEYKELGEIVDHTAVH